jgi:site-specific recombinase XerD
MKKSTTVSFYLKKDKINSDGLSPIYAKIRYEITLAVTISTSCWIKQTEWNSTKRLKNTKSKEHIEIERHLATIKEKIYKREAYLNANELPITSKLLAEAVKVKKSASLETPKKKTFLMVFQEYIAEKVNLQQQSQRSTATCTKYYSTQKHVTEYIKKVCKQPDFELERLNLSFLDNFYLFLLQKKKIGNNTAQKYVQFLRSCVFYSIRHGYLEKDPFANYKYKWDEVETVYLTNEELKALETKVFATERLDVVRDIFLFTCYTGLAPIDLQRITYDNIKVQNDKNKWILINRQKTKIASNVMLLPKVEELIEKYKTNIYCQANNKVLPYRTNQITNEYLKEVACLCGINKNLTHYVARHTFATTVMLENGISIEVLSEAMGHKRLQQTLHYAKITDTKRSKEFMELKDKLK